jgi:hypothetical protein
MKCAGCGAELAAGASTCAACGRAAGMGQKAEAESVKLAKETGAAAEKVGKGLWSGAKSLGASAKKEFKHSDDDKKQS